MKRILGAVALGLLMAAPASAAVVNGSFEDGLLALNGEEWGVFNSIVGWNTISGSGIEVQTNPTLGSINAQDGFRYVELDSNNNSAMRQTLNLVAGHYLLSFWYAPRQNLPASEGIKYTIGALTGIVNTPYVANTWTNVTRRFYANGAPVYLEFAAEGTSDSYGTFVDSVSVAAVPVPAAGLMLFAALGGLAALRRRKAVS